MNDQQIERRSWLRSVLRTTTLGGIGLLTWELVSRRGGACFRLTPSCQGCELLARCRLPRALNAQQRGENAEVGP